MVFFHKVLESILGSGITGLYTLIAGSEADLALTRKLLKTKGEMSGKGLLAVQ